MNDAKDVTTTSFGLVIAYLLPGLAGLLSLTFWSSSVNDVFRAFLTTQSSVGLFLLVVTASLIVGLEIGIVRWFIFEYLLCRNVFLTSEDYALLQSAKLDSFRVMVDEIYRHSQFFGGMAIVLPLLYLGWYINASAHLSRTAVVVITAGALVLEVLTVAATKVSYERFVNRARLILKGGTMSNGVPGPGEHKSAPEQHGSNVEGSQRPATPEELAARDQPPPLKADSSPKKGVEAREAPAE